MISTAQDTLNKAKYFAARAAEFHPHDLTGFCNNLEAAIVFTRSVTFHIQKEFSHSPGFDSWYRGWQDKLAAERISKFFLEKRNYLLKQGKLEVSRHISLKATVAGSSRLIASLTVIRGQPWYRRSPRILLEDLSYPVRVWFHEWRERRREARKKPEREDSEAPEVSFHFAEPEWNSKPALDLLDSHLKILQDLVTDCESRFVPEVETNGDSDPS